MKCEQCNKHEATVLFTHIVESEKRTTRLCSSCVSKIKEIGTESMHASEKSTTSAMNSADSISTEVCLSCGATYEDLKKTGRLSCADCYFAFEPQLFVRDGINYYFDLETLKTELEAAVEEEAFERAAEIRDRIKQMEEEKVGDNID